MKRVLVLYSGGKDSLLSTLLLIEQGYQVYLVHYDNVYEIGKVNVKKGFKRLEKKYGSEKIRFIGIKKIDAIFRELIKEFYNTKANEIVQKFGNISISQFNCLACRLSMYIETIILCKQLGISVVADGARISQKFAIEQEEMLQLFILLFKEYNIDMLFPVKDLEDDFQEKNELLVRGIIPKVNEAQCLLGMPLEKDFVNNDELMATIRVYKELLHVKVDGLVKRYSKVSFGEEYV